MLVYYSIVVDKWSEIISDYFAILRAMDSHERLRKGREERLLELSIKASYRRYSQTPKDG